VERAAAQILAGHPRIPTPALLASGRLAPPGVDWDWPYLVFEFIPSVSLGEARAQVPFAGQLHLAGELGAWMAELHAAPLPPGGPFEPGWHAYLAFLEGQRAGCARRHAGWGSLPAHLAEQMEAYLPPAADLRLPGERPHLIHADLTQDHLLGRVERGRWTSLALIDFGDARTGSLFYELPALHFSLFGGDKRLLAAFLQAYGYAGPTGEEFTRRAMACALLHQFDVFSEAALPTAWREAATLEQAADILWRVD